MISLVYKGILLKNAMGFNRTFMELKPRNTSCNVVDALRFNRTFMELKPWTLTASSWSFRVLIGPSWN